MGKSFNVRSDQGSQWTFSVSDGGVLQDVTGPWSADAAVTFPTVPSFVRGIEPLPVHIEEYANHQKLTVCFYDPVACKTCFCDDAGRMRCVNMC